MFEGREIVVLRGWRTRAPGCARAELAESRAQSQDASETRIEVELSHRVCDTCMDMKTAATIDVTVPENRKLELELPPEVPAGKAKLLVMIEEPADRRDLPEARVESVDGRLRLALPKSADVDWEEVSVKRSRDQRTRKLLGMG